MNYPHPRRNGGLTFLLKFAIYMNVSVPLWFTKEEQSMSVQVLRLDRRVCIFMDKYG